MHDFTHYLHVIVDFFRDGLREGFDRVNAVLGLIIAIFAVYMMSAWKRIWEIALGATVAHLIAEVMLPFLANQERLRLPPNLLELSYWRAAAALYLGYLLVITIFYFVKTRLLPRGRH
ncbi:MAG: hypothetical protein ACLQUZ_12295 [Rhizomicrobium sp.]